MPNQGKPTFCPACWGCFTDGGIRRHILSAHFWCQRCNIVGLHRKIAGHMKSHPKIKGRISECLGACACAACGAAWDDATARHNCWGEGMAHPATEMGRFCADGCGAWLGDREAARRHHAGCGGIAEELRVRIPSLATEFVMGSRRLATTRPDRATPSSATSSRGVSVSGSQTSLGVQTGGSSDTVSWGGSTSQSPEPQSPDDPPPDADADPAGEYVQRAERMFEEARACAARTAASSFMQKGSQMWHDVDRFRNFLEVCVVGKPLSADEYLAKVRAGMPLEPGEWILCRAEQAREVLSAGPLQRAMLVPQGARQTSTKDDVMAWLDEQRQQIDVHDQAAKNPNREVWAPKTMSVDEFRGLMAEDEPWPLNVLSLRAFCDNIIPPCMEDLRHYKVFDTIVADEGAGGSGSGGKYARDGLTGCSSFGLFATRGAISMPHVDQHGVITTATCEFGEKLWLSWTGLPADRLVAYADAFQGEERKIPDWLCVGIAMGPRDILVQPAGTLHALYSLTDVGMSRTMHWARNAMVESARVALLTSQYGNLTNEDMNKCLGNKLERIAAVWQS